MNQLINEIGSCPKGTQMPQKTINYTSLEESHRSWLPTCQGYVQKPGNHQKPKKGPKKEKKKKRPKTTTTKNKLLDIE